MILTGRETMEGAGVRLNRVFGHAELPHFDPFLMLDHFGSKEPRDYIRGFPWHPHRGIETVTYMLQGEVEHGDSMKNTGLIGPGDVQWMTAGSGIIHQEMPRGGPDNAMEGFQLWVNLPASHKMMPPRYREVRAGDIPLVDVDGAAVRLICGDAFGAKGPVEDIVTAPVFLDVSLPAGKTFAFDAVKGHTLCIYVFEGKGEVSGRGVEEALLERGQALLAARGARLDARAAEGPLRFLLFSGRPLDEPVAWHGPIVMNTEAELNLAFEEFYQGTFIK